MVSSKLDHTSQSVNALLNLLTAAGLDTVDNSTIEREKDRCHVDIRTDLLPDEPQAWDRQVEKLIRQLKESIRDTPERDIMADMPQHQQLDHEPQNQQPQPQYETEQQQQQQGGVPEEDDRRQYLEREFSSTSYPKIGPGYSDSISVVSDLTIPTVVAGMAPEEEKYEGPPMQIGFERKQSSSSSKQQLRRPSLEKNRREAATQLRPPSRRVVTRPGGAAANRRQNHQMTMAQLSGQHSSNSPPPPGAPKSKQQARGAGNTMTVNDFPSLKEVSGTKDEFGSRRSSGSRGERRSLLGKSNKYAASVSATASQRMLLARQASAKKSSSSRRRRASTTTSTTEEQSTSSSPTKKGDDSNGFGFSSLDASTKTDDASKKSGDPVLIDEDGFIIGGEQTDPFAVAAPSFPTAFSKDTFSNTFFPAPAKDTKKKKGARRGSLSMPPKKEDRIAAVELATKKKLDILRRAAEGDAAFGNRVDMVEQETMKQIRRIREHYK